MLRSLVLVALSALVTMSSGCSSKSDGGTTNPAVAVTPDNSKTWCDVKAPTCAAVNVCGVCVKNPPSTALVRTTDAKEYFGSGPPDVACLSGTGLKPLDPAASKKVTMRGYVKIFANGPDSRNVKVEVYKEILDASGGPTGQLGELVGSTVSTDKLPDGTGTKNETITKAGKDETRVLYPYEIVGLIPTESPLIVKTSSKTSVDVDGWFPLYDFNQIVRNDGVTGDVWSFDVRALGNDDYASILKAAYNRPPEGGKSAIAGEVHDCGDVRLSNATVGLAPTGGLPLFYLSEVEDDPLPQAGRTATGRLGLYAQGGMTPGIYTVAAAGTIGTSVLALGSYPVQTFPDSVSVFTFRGLRSWQVPKK
jgi:hypothetical protein